MSGHHDQVEAPPRLIVLRTGLDPFNVFCAWFTSSHSQHRCCRINTRHPVSTFGERTAERAGTATYVEDTTWAHSGEGEVEVGILRPRVSEVVNLCNQRVLIVHTLVALSPRPPTDLQRRCCDCSSAFITRGTLPRATSLKERRRTRIAQSVSLSISSRTMRRVQFKNSNINMAGNLYLPNGFKTPADGESIPSFPIGKQFPRLQTQFQTVIVRAVGKS